MIQMMGLDKQMKKAWYRQEWKVPTVYPLTWVVGKGWREGLLDILKESSNR